MIIPNYQHISINLVGNMKNRYFPGNVKTKWQARNRFQTTERIMIAARSILINDAARCSWSITINVSPKSCKIADLYLSLHPQQKLSSHGIPLNPLFLLLHISCHLFHCFHFFHSSESSIILYASVKSHAPFGLKLC